MYTREIISFPETSFIKPLFEQRTYSNSVLVQKCDLPDQLDFLMTSPVMCHKSYFGRSQLVRHLILRDLQLPVIIMCNDMEQDKYRTATLVGNFCGGIFSWFGFKK